MDLFKVYFSLHIVTFLSELALFVFGFQACQRQFVASSQCHSCHLVMLEL